MKKSSMFYGFLLAWATSLVRAQLPEEFERIGRCVDNQAIRTWMRCSDGISSKMWEHDGKSWRQREREFNFRVIGLRPTDFPCNYVRLPSFPPGLKEHSPIDLSFDFYFISSFVMSADECHYGISRVAERMSNKQIMGPLACRTTAAIMKNVGGVGGVVGREPQITKDNYPYPVEIHLHYQYLDPDAAAAYIKQREEQSK